jgi:hypothetical protein
MGEYSPEMGNGEQSVEIKMPLQLVERIRGYCRKQNITMDNFILDAVTAKLQSANQERRKRQRL